MMFVARRQLLLGNVRNIMAKVNQNIIKVLEDEQLKSDVPEFGPGDTVVVKVRVKEGNKERLQAFEGVVIAKRNRGLHSSFTVRKMSSGEGVERVFPNTQPTNRQHRAQASRCSTSC